MAFYNDTSCNNIKTNYITSQITGTPDLGYNFPKLITGSVTYQNGGTTFTINNSSLGGLLPVTNSIYTYYAFIQNFIFSSSFTYYNTLNNSASFLSSSVAHTMVNYTNTSGTLWTSTVSSFSGTNIGGYTVYVSQITTDTSSGITTFTLADNIGNEDNYGTMYYSLLILG